MRQYKVLVVDDETDMLQVCKRILEDKSYVVATATDGPEALELLRREPVDVAVLDLRLPSMSGLDVMREALRINPNVAVLIITAQATMDTAIQAVRDGAFDLIPKPFSASQLEVAVDRSVNYKQLQEQNQELQKELRAAYQFDNV
ncbi:MAG TPA: response regulator, partial [Candidatus Angelobacter sp.]